MSVDAPKPPTVAGTDRVEIASSAPIQKVTYGAIAGAIVALVLWGLSLLKVNVPAEVAGALTVLVTLAVAYMTPLKRSEIVMASAGR